MAVFLLDVGNSSEVCKMITANTAESANLPSNATTIISVLLSGMKTGLVNILFFYFHYFMLTLIQNTYDLVFVEQCFNKNLNSLNVR